MCFLLLLIDCRCISTVEKLISLFIPQHALSENISLFSVLNICRIEKNFKKILTFTLPKCLFYDVYVPHLLSWFPSEILNGITFGTGRNKIKFPGRFILSNPNTKFPVSTDDSVFFNVTPSRSVFIFLLSECKSCFNLQGFSVHEECLHLSM